MKCPHCATEILLDSEHSFCSCCKADLRWLRTIDGLERDLDSVYAESARLERRLADIRRSVTDVKSQVVTARPPTERPTAATNQSPVASPSAVDELEAPATETHTPPPDSSLESTRLPSSTRKIEPPLRSEFGATPIPSIKQSAAASAERTEVLVAQRWFLVIGIATVVFGIAFFLKYAFDRNWIPPVARIAMAYAAGIGLGGAGELFRRRKLETFGLALTGGGIATAYFATFAAYHFFALFPIGVAFTIMGAITAAACALALLHDGRLLAILGFLGGFLTPVMLGSGEDRPVVLFNYLAILNIGCVAIVARRRWSELLVIAFGFTWFLFFAWFALHYASDRIWLAQCYLHGFVLLHVLGPLTLPTIAPVTPVTVGSRIAGKLAAGLAPALAAMSGGLGLFFSLAMFGRLYNDETRAIVPALYGVLFLAVGMFVSRRERSERPPIGGYLGAGLTFLAIAAPFCFEGHRITIAWAALAAFTTFLSRRIKSQPLAIGGIALLSFATARFFALDLPQQFTLTDDVHYAEFFVVDAGARWLTALSLLGAGIATGRLLPWARARKPRLPVPLDIAVPSAAITAFFLFTNVEVSALFHEISPRANAASLSVLWTLWSAGLLTAGLVFGQTWIRRVALTLFAATVGKVFLSDMSGVDAPFRIVSFIVLGLVLIAVSWVYHRYKDRIMRRSIP